MERGNNAGKWHSVFGAVLGWLVRDKEWLVSVWLRVGELFGGLSTVCYRPYFLVLVVASF